MGVREVYQSHPSGETAGRLSGLRRSGRPRNESADEKPRNASLSKDAREGGLMPKGLSLHIGLNEVDPAHYGNVQALSAAENDPVLMERIARDRGFETKLLIGSSATTSAVENARCDAAGRLVAGDIFLITYAGHGSQVPDRNGDEV